ncbi:MAG: NADH-quinone oxidoreductase subunit NuoE [Armatimonadota bacterium]|jgi:NADH-quinone oxidoreductase subunit E
MTQAVAVREPAQDAAGRRFERIQQLVEEYGASRSALIPILQKAQEEYRYLPEEILTFIATALDLPPSTVFGVATFYAQFSLEPVGKYVIKVCDGTACHVRKNQALISSLRSRLGLKEGQKTTPDMRYTLEIVSCIGACALAPAVVINDRVYGQMTADKMKAVLDEIERAEAAAAGDGKEER